MGGLVEKGMPREIKKPLNKVFNKLGDWIIPAEIAKPLMIAGAFMGPWGYLVSALGQGKEYGKLDYDALAMQVAMNQTMKQPTSNTPGNLGVSVHGGTPYQGANLGGGARQGVTTAMSNTAPLTMTPATPQSSFWSGVGDVRNQFLGDPRDRMLMEGFQSPYTKAGGWQNPIVGGPGESWQSLKNPWKPGPMTKADSAAFTSGLKDVGAATTAQVGMMEQKEIIEDEKKRRKKEAARTKDWWRNYFAGIERYYPGGDPANVGGEQMGGLYAQYGAADEYDPYYGMKEAWAGTDYADDRYYNVKNGGRIGLALGGNDDIGGLSSLTSQIPQNVPGVPNGKQVDGRVPGGTYIDAGTRPKADDVAAMLSEGEFVITKDGMEGFDIKTGGPGDSRSGAKKMYAQMNEWETIAEQAGV